MHSHRRSIALIGAPNAGKTTLFNWLTGSRHKTVNYPGSTTEYSIGVCLTQYEFDVSVIDTPGTYSLFPKTPDEQVTSDVIYHNQDCQPEIFIVVVDATQFSRQMTLAKQVNETGHPVIVALTMTDLLPKPLLLNSINRLREKLSLPVVAIDGKLGGGVNDLIKLARDLSLPSTDIKKKPLPLTSWSHDDFSQWNQHFQSLFDECFQESPQAVSQISLRTENWDRWLLHPLFGPFFFLLIMGALFVSIFWISTPFSDLIDTGITGLSQWTFQMAPESLWTDFLGNGVIAGFGAFLVFVPQIFILFFGLNLIEDSGYLARASALVDRPLSRLGLNGRSFAPILSGYACAVPAMMATRTIPNRRERWLTLLILPLMTCSARLPVYAILLSFLFPQSAFYAGLGLLSLYLLSVFFGGVTSLVAKKFLPKEQNSFFMLELPHYKRPQLKNVLKYATHKTLSFVKRAGPIIFVLAVLLWFLSTFPHYQEKDDFKKVSTSYAAQLGQWMEPVMKPMGLDWRVGFGIVSSIAAREVFISSLAIVFNIADEDENTLSQNLLQKMRAAKNVDNEPIFTTATIMGLLIFYVIALQCIATIGVAYQETQSWKFALGQFVLFNLMAYSLAVSTVWTLRSLGVA